MLKYRPQAMLWFDTKFRRYSTFYRFVFQLHPLWFDTKFRRYSTAWKSFSVFALLWFDTKFRRYSTLFISGVSLKRCGLIQNSEDIQRCQNCQNMVVSCGLIQNSEDIQLNQKLEHCNKVVV